MKRKVGCAIFLLLGFAWLGFVGIDLFVSTYGDCGDEPLCGQLKSVLGSRAMWRGFAGGLLLVLGYIFFRSMTGDDEVH